MKRELSEQMLPPPEPEHVLKGAPPTKRVYKLVLTGGPCGGKTTAQAKLATFFESIGWKVFRVPETATVLMSGGIAFGELNQDQVIDFQENLIRTMIALEDTYFSMASKSSTGQNCLVICDRGTMDASAFVDRQEWEDLLEKLQLAEVDICEGRYDHVVHMVTAAIGAEDFYSVDGHAARFEGLDLARERDHKAMEAWKMHPYVDIVDNRKDFQSKLKHLVDIVVRRTGIDIGDQFKPDSRKVKFVVAEMPKVDNEAEFFTDFEVLHHYLLTGGSGVQSRLRKRTRQGRSTFVCTVRRPERKGQTVEVKTPLLSKDYETLLNHVDERHYPVYKTRRCFLYKHQQYQLDVYNEPCHSRCRGLILLETFTTLPAAEIQANLPPFVKIVKDVTGDPAFSMYNLALKSDWTDHFCHHELQHLQNDERAREAHKRFVETTAANNNNNEM